MPRYAIDINKTYQIPHDIRVVEYDDKSLVIAPDTANWIVLNSSAQLDIFEYLHMGCSIKETLAKPQVVMRDLNYVVTQVEAKRFCTKKIRSSVGGDRSMHLYLTNRCNLLCPHCYMFSGRANENELTTEEILKLISDYKEIANGKFITLSGGEPVTHPDFDLIVMSAAEIGLEVKVLTNGTLMSPERIERLAGYIYSVQISIDGFSEESNSLIRGKGNFQKALSAIDTLVNLGVDTAVAITPPYEVLKDHIEDYLVFAKELSRKYKGKALRIKFADELLQGRQISPSRDFNKEYSKLIHKIQFQLYGIDSEVLSFVETLHNNSILDNCMFGHFAVASNGDVFYCSRIGDLSPIANVRTTTMNEIVSKALAAERASLISNLKPCNECELRYICGGGCRIEEFPEFAKKKSFENLDVDSIPAKQCSCETKEQFYDLMIRSDKYFYSPLE